jgi:uncharacterized cupredoxin-like copper-binding protein
MIATNMTRSKRSLGREFRQVAASGVAMTLGSLICVLGPAAQASAQEVLAAQLWNKPDGSQGLTLNSYQLKPDVVVFEVKNTSSNEDHELLLIKTDQPPSSLPKKADGTGVDESKLSDLRELGDLHPGQSKATAVPLTPGKYLVFCNEPGHFKAGMYAQITVSN